MIWPLWAAAPCIALGVLWIPVLGIIGYRMLERPLED